jgi:hypothetical protein
MPTRKQASRKTKRNKAPQPIGAGKKGSGKRAIYKAGGGKKALAIWRSLDQEIRKSIRQRDDGFDDIMATIAATGDLREGLGKNRVTGKPKKPKASKPKAKASSRRTEPVLKGHAQKAQTAKSRTRKARASNSKTPARKRIKNTPDAGTQGKFKIAKNTPGVIRRANPKAPGSTGSGGTGGGSKNVKV